MNKKIILIGIVILLIGVGIGFGINIILKPSGPAEISLDNITATTTTPNQLAQVQWTTPTKVENLKSLKVIFIKLKLRFIR